MNFFSVVAMRKLFLAITIQTISEIDTEHHMQLHGKCRNQCGALDMIGWNVGSRNTFTGNEFGSIQSLNSVTQFCLKTVCKSIRSAQDPVRIDIFQDSFLYIHGLLIYCINGK